MEARDVMTAPVVTVAPDTPVVDLARLLLERRISAVPVVDAAGRMLGIVSEGDLMRHAQAGTGRSRSWWLSIFADRGEIAQAYVKSHGNTAEDVMTRSVVTATESTPLDKIATLLERHRIKRLPITRRGKVVGIVSRANLLHGLVAQKAPATKTIEKDRDIRARILEDLGAAGVDKGYVNVVVSKGVVDLWGLVDTPAQKRAIVLAAKAANGVTSVIDNVSVMSPKLRNALAQ